ICLLLLMVLGACENYFQQERQNLIITGTIQEVRINSALVDGLLLDVGDEPDTRIRAYGHCWSSNSNPSIDDSTKTNFGTSDVPRPFQSFVGGLAQETTYFIRAYIQSEDGEVVYGSSLEFVPGLVSSNGIGDIRASSAQGIGLLSSNAQNFQSIGFCWNTEPSPTIDNFSAQSNVSEGELFFADLTGLTPVTQYFTRAFLIDQNGFVVYGEELTFTTNQQ
ncbi:MAG: hypothetical protein AAFU64_03460, partial [Bacteroidota bacterium]